MKLYNEYQDPTEKEPLGYIVVAVIMAAAFVFLLV